MVMTYRLAKVPVASEDKRNRRTDGGDCITSHINAVGNKPCDWHSLWIFNFNPCHCSVNGKLVITLPWWTLKLIISSAGAHYTADMTIQSLSSMYQQRKGDCNGLDWNVSLHVHLTFPRARLYWHWSSSGEFIRVIKRIGVGYEACHLRTSFDWFQCSC